MSTLECLACAHDNEAGAPFCVVCGTSLNLKLCVSCEAVNNSGATHCHSCGTDLSVEAAEPPPQSGKPPDPAVEQPPFRAPQRWRVIEADHSRVKRAALWTARLLGASALVALGAVGYHFHGHWLPALQAAVAIPAPTPAPAPAPAPVPVVASEAGDTSRAESPVPLAASAPAPKRAVAAVKPAPKATVAKDRLPGLESSGTPAVRRTPASVTHLRSDVPAVAIVAPTAEEKPIVSEEKPVAEVRVSRVTHTKPGVGVVTGEATPAPAAATVTVSAPAAPRKETAGKCPEAAAVLGLCSANLKGE